MQRGGGDAPGTAPVSSISGAATGAASAYPALHRLMSPCGSGGMTASAELLLLLVSGACFKFRAILNRDDDRVLEGHAAASRGGEKSTEPQHIAHVLGLSQLFLCF
jgi:hypothetical protein